MFLIMVFLGTEEVIADSEPIVVYDIRHLSKGLAVQDAVTNAFYTDYDKMLALESLQGNVNRDRPRLMLDFLMLNSAVGPKYIVDGLSQSRSDSDMSLFDNACAPSSRDVCISSYRELNGRQILRFTEADVTNVTVGKLSIEDLISRYYRNDIKGLVVWDRRVAATSNAAMTIAGADGLMVVLHDPLIPKELLGRLKRIGLQERINLYRLNFTNPNVIPGGGAATGSTKNNVYRWLLEEYVKTGKVVADNLGYRNDAKRSPRTSSYFETTAFDFLVGKRAMIFDLSPWGDEKPADDPNQPLGADLQTFKLILNTYDNVHPKVKQFYGFPLWAKKYTNYGEGGKHESVETEWQFIRLISHAGFYSVDNYGYTGCCGSEWVPLMNTSFYTHISRVGANHFLNDGSNVPKVVPNIENKTYLMFIMGDYDSSAAVWRTLLNNPLIWGSSARGKLPLAWSINPRKLEEIPILADLLQATKTKKDFFVAEEGPGYVDIQKTYGFPQDQLNSLVAVARSSYQATHIDFTSLYFTHGGPDNIPNYADLAKFSPLGIGAGNGQQSGHIGIVNGQTPICKARITFGNEDTLDLIVSKFEQEQADTPDFLCIRVVFRTPDEIVTLVDRLKQTYPGKNYEVVDPYTMHGLIAKKYNTPWELPVYAMPNIPTATSVPKKLGDANGDGKVDTGDFLAWMVEFLGQKKTKSSDFNHDNKVDLFDLETWRVVVNH